MTTANPGPSDRSSVGPAPRSEAESVARATRPGTGNAWNNTWGLLNTPAGGVASVAAALGGMVAVFLTVFLGQLNRMEDRLEEQIRGIREDIIELRASDHEREQRLLAHIRDLERRLLEPINRGTGQTDGTPRLGASARQLP